ncbi:hypothetical protein HC022_06315 [Salipiger sp. HF18]|uniref:hypothetical protein n=1 Tax=Salipiger sp. HF18 TaxID=2721557 RepID=UPI00142E2978|nr:hypothetical protein [Salipiger sp. HF18]NIY95877.1 hypothetical protein [Salipiger sp. HF18]
MFCPIGSDLRPELKALLEEARAEMRLLRCVVQNRHLETIPHSFDTVTIAPLTDQQPVVTPAARRAVGTSRPRRISSLSAAWAKFWDVEQRFSDSIWGDAIGCISLVIFAVSALFIAWGLQ